jgi:hypothetical protein
MKLKITSNRHPRPLVSFYEVPNGVILTQFDYLIPRSITDNPELIPEWLPGNIQVDDEPSASFFRYQGFWYHASMFGRTDQEGWDGWYHESISTGVLIKVHGDDSVIVGNFRMVSK